MIMTLVNTTWNVNANSTINGSQWTSASTNWNEAGARNSTPVTTATFVYETAASGAMYIGVDNNSSSTTVPSTTTSRFSYEIYHDYASNSSRAQYNGTNVGALASISTASVVKFVIDTDVKIYYDNVLQHTFSVQPNSSTDYYQSVQGVGTASVSGCQYIAASGGGSGGGSSGGGSSGGSTPDNTDGSTPIEHILYLNTRVPK